MHKRRISCSSAHGGTTAAFYFNFRAGCAGTERAEGTANSCAVRTLKEQWQLFPDTNSQHAGPCVVKQFVCSWLGACTGIASTVHIGQPRPAPRRAPPRYLFRVVISSRA